MAKNVEKLLKKYLLNTSLLSILAVWTTSGFSRPLHNYEIAQTISFAPNFSTATLNICNQRKTPVEYYSTLDSAARYLKPIYTSNSKASHFINSAGKLVIRQKGCFEFLVNLSKYRQSAPSSNRQHHLLTSGLLFWYPNYIDTTAEWMAFRKHHLVQIKTNSTYSLPFTEISEHHFLYPPYLPFMSQSIPIGEFEQVNLEFNHSEKLKARLNFLDPFTKDEQSAITSWISIAISGVNQIADLPSDTIQVNLFKASHYSREVTPFALVERGEGTTISMKVRASATLEQLISDWTAFHEFSHLLLPFIRRQDAWMSEGFASYLQYFAMPYSELSAQHNSDSQSKDKSESAVDAFNDFMGGIDRGIRNHNRHPNKSLQTLSEQLRSTRAYRAVYWWGALIWFEIDLSLREQSTSLPELIDQFNRCCRFHRAMWTATELAKSLDKLIEKPFILQLIQERRHQSDYPKYSLLLNKIGVQDDGNRNIKLVDSDAFNRFFRIYRPSD
ncbi:MAG: hypothetical protein HWE27_18675 [Gammaproteobacteria bacterium]|nr:hypothetical protein [Gammaproteobacteria bacterium]